MTKNTIKTFVIVGGGTAGWMTAAALSRMLQPEHVSVTLVESDAIGTVGVGEATIPDIANFNKMLGIQEADFLKATSGTFKLGIEFSNWGKLGDKYFHPFGTHGVDMNGIDFHQYWLHSLSDSNHPPLESYSMCAVAAKQAKFSFPSSNPRAVTSSIRYAYHFDAIKYATFLREYAQQRGVNRVEGTIRQVSTNPKTGNIDALELESGQRITADFFFDCSGLRALLIDKTLGVQYKDWSHWLPCNSAQAIPTERTEPLLPFTKAIAQKAGWQWRIPTQHRTGNGHIYSRDFLDDEEATQILLDNVDAKPIGEPRTIRFTTGCRDQFWYKNCVAIGLSGGFLEPLESTSIYLIQQGISRFMSLFPSLNASEVIIDEYNRLMCREFEQVRDFIILHYKATERDDSEFWRYCSAMTIPDTLQHKIDLFKAGGRVFRDDNELFTRPSWIAVMLGQNIYPDNYDPMLANIPRSDIQRSLNSMSVSMTAAVEKMKTHAEFIKQYAK
ncbi:tryptophan halogenase family protein [Alteromonas sp. KUL49]|uniref:tryptophan halogenase family protein n=1 Tax=Alteromonas sp. KUL49 TaxID=2480798 RepID=UPI00102F1528|nr:tryptophan halogenase family protein [Alteromonas sp. KUL49]TAP42285.1 tryptophan 7-halogenase [Alteromonas sp. KUL49]GEA09891.1 tryptophan halogenase [Alteromonas sp. KUL49]